MGDFKAIETQEQLEAIITEQLKEKKKIWEKEYEGYLSPDEEAKKYSGYLSPDAEKEKYKGYLSPEEVSKKDAQIKDYETKSLKARIAHEAGIPYELAERLSGEDEKAIRKDAESLSKLIGGNTTLPLRSSEASDQNSENAAYRSMLNEMKGE